MKERFGVLDIFRGIFSSLVVFFHLSTFSNTIVLNNEFVYNCDLFVDFFFVLSGFVIAYSYQHIKTGQQLWKFYKKRFFRLYPLHLIVLLIFVAIEIPKHFISRYVHVNKVDNVSNNVETFFSNLFLVNSVKLPGVNDVSWNIVSWSISAEMIAYLVFGLTVLFINHFGLLKIKTIIYVFLIFMAGFMLYLFTSGFKLMYSFDYGFLRGILGFFIGVVCFAAFNAAKQYLRTFKDVVFSIAEVVLLFITIIFVCYGAIFKSYGFIYEALFFMTILIFAFEKGWISGLLKKSHFLYQAGKYSYSIYMVHTLIFSLFNVVFIRLLKLPPSSYAYLFIVNYALVYIISAWTFKNIEMRFNKISSSQKDKKTWWLW